MIKKLDLPSSARLVCKKDYDLAFKYIKQTVNQLVDAVNEIMTWRFETDDVQTPAENVQSDAESRPENVQDKFAEQRRWIGCLCELWSGNSKNHRYGILKGIAKNTYKGHKTIHKYQALSMSFEHREPVKPDSNIIYKGDNNE